MLLVKVRDAGRTANQQRETERKTIMMMPNATDLLVGRTLGPMNGDDERAGSVEDSEVRRKGGAMDRIVRLGRAAMALFL